MDGNVRDPASAIQMNGDVRDPAAAIQMDGDLPDPAAAIKSGDVCIYCGENFWKLPAWRRMDTM